MKFAARYPGRINRWSLVSIAIVGLALGAEAQIFGPRASITSLGDGFTLDNPPGVRASVTSLGPQGFTPRFPRGPVSPAFNRPLFRDHHRRFNGGVVLPVYAIPYYYADYPAVVEPTDTSMEENYGPGPTIFDRRGSQASSADLERQYDERLSRLEKQLDAAEAKDSSTTSAQAETPETPAAAQPSTLLVFRDGHTSEVENYAIVGDTLYDFSSGLRHKIPLTDLDLGATQKQNENRGVDFHLPAGSGS